MITQVIQYIPRNMHTVFALLCFVVVIHWLIFPYPSGLLHWHCGNLTIAPVPAKQPWWIWINTSCEFIMNDCITTTKQSTTKPCAYFLGYTVYHMMPAGEFPSQRPVTRSFDDFFDLQLNKRLNKNRDTADLKRHRAHYDLTVMSLQGIAGKVCQSWSEFRSTCCPIQWNLSVTTTSKIKFVTCDLFNKVF